MNNDKFIAKAAKALGDKHQLLLLREIARRGSIDATQAQEIINQAQPSVSYHIKQLTNSELIETFKVGRNVNMTINRTKLLEFSQFFDRIIEQSPILKV